LEKCNFLLPPTLLTHAAVVVPCSLTRAAQIRFVSGLHEIAELGARHPLIDLGADLGELVLGDQLLQRLAEAEVWQRNKEDPFQRVADLRRAQLRYLEYEDSHYRHRSCNVV